MQHTACHVSLPCHPTHLPACMAMWASAWARAEKRWVLEPRFYLVSLGSQVHLCCSRAAPRVTAKVLAGHHVVGVTEAFGILHRDSPTRTKCSTGITFVSRQGTETNTYCKTWLSPIWPELWMPVIFFPTAKRWPQSHSHHLCPPKERNRRSLGIPETDGPQRRAEIQSLGVQCGGARCWVCMSQLSHIWLLSLPWLLREMQSLS